MSEPSQAGESLESILGKLKRQYEDFRPYGEKCPECGTDRTFAYHIEDVAFSFHYIDKVAEYICSGCGHKWSGQYGYFGLA